MIFVVILLDLSVETRINNQFLFLTIASLQSQPAVGSRGRPLAGLDLGGIRR